VLKTGKHTLACWVVILSLAISANASDESAVVKDYKKRIAKYVELHKKVYFIVGSSAKLREGNIAKTNLTAKGFDQDNVFLVAEIVGDQMRFQTIARTGQIVDSGSIRRAEKTRRTAGR